MSTLACTNVLNVKNVGTEIPPKCLNCGEDDHTETDCINDSICINCLKVNRIN